MQTGVLKHWYLVSASGKLIHLCVVKRALLNYVNIRKARPTVFPKADTASKASCVCNVSGD